MGAALLFAFRGPFRVIQKGGCDFTVPYEASWRLFHGLNPYDPANFIEDWRSLGGPSQFKPYKAFAFVPYPPSTLVAVAPFIIFRWNVALALYVGLCTLLYILLLYRMSTYLVTANARLAFWAIGLAFSPILTGFSIANITVLTFLTAAHGVLLAKHKPILAGVLVGIGVCLKPTVAISFAALLLFFRCWQSFGACALVTALASGGAVIKLRDAPGWNHSFASNLTTVLDNNGMNSFSSPFDHRFDLLSMQVPIYCFTHSVMISNIVAVGTAAVLCVWWSRKYLRRQQLDWAPIASLTLISLLPVYQRNYCGSVAIFAVIWAITNLQKCLYARWTLLLSTVFLIPGESLLRDMASRLPTIFIGSVGKGVLFAHATWAILAIIVMILASKEQSATGDLSIARQRL